MPSAKVRPPARAVEAVPSVDHATRQLVDALRAELRAERASTPPRLLTVAESAALLRISRESLYQLMRRGELGSVQVGRRRLIPESEVRRLADV
jgi:excisionase family DNA binding protein